MSLRHPSNFSNKLSTVAIGSKLGHWDGVHSFPANTSYLHQRWKNFDYQLSSTLFERWYLVET